MDKFIIGIAGKKGAGKDTFASMIDYILGVGIAKATFVGYMQYMVTRKSNTTIHFADKLKDCVSIIYNIPREYFDNREYKDELLYCLEEHRFLTRKDAVVGYNEITISELDCENLCDIANTCKGKACVTLRTLLQYFGTDMCRNMLGYDIWIKSCMNNAVDIADKYGHCCIADIRFTNEAKAISDSFLYGGLVMIKRDTHNTSNHSSENVYIDCPTVIENNGTKAKLFYQALSFVTSIKNK